MTKKKSTKAEILKDSISALEYSGKSAKRFIVGIDPDLKKPGYAIWDQQLNEWSTYGSVTIDELEKILVHYPVEEVTIYLEAGWMNKISNFHGKTGRVAQNIAMKVGQNHATSKSTCSALQALGFEVINIKPLFKGILKGVYKNGQRRGVWTEAGKAYILENTGITAKMNDEVRDALYIVINKRK